MKITNEDDREAKMDWYLILSQFSPLTFLWETVVISSRMSIGWCLMVPDFDGVRAQPPSPPTHLAEGPAEKFCCFSYSLQ